MEKSTVKDFNYDDCFKLGCLMVKNHDPHANPIAIRIYYDDLIVFQYIMEGRDVGNLPWLERKANTVRKTGMASIEVVKAIKAGKYLELKEDKTVALYGGGYPLYQDGKLTCIICVSGMDNDEDDAKIIDQAVKEYLRVSKKGV